MMNPWKAALATLVFGSYLIAEQISPATGKAVEAAEMQWKEAVLGANGSVLASLIADDITYTHSNAMTQSKEKFIESVVSGQTKYQSIVFKTTQMRQYGDSVIVIHDALFNTTQAGATHASHLYLTHVWSQRNGHWQLVSRQATKIVDSPQ